MDLTEIFTLRSTFSHIALKRPCSQGFSNALRLSAVQQTPQRKTPYSCFSSLLAFLHFREMAARMALLKHLRVSVVRSAPQNPNFNTPFSSLGSLLQRRRFSDQVRGSFLDKSEVTDRVVTIVKNFQKVDPSKVLALNAYSTKLSVVCF